MSIKTLIGGVVRQFRWGLGMKLITVNYYDEVQKVKIGEFVENGDLVKFKSSVLDDWVYICKDVDLKKRTEVAMKEAVVYLPWEFSMIKEFTGEKLKMHHADKKRIKKEESTNE